MIHLRQSSIYIASVLAAGLVGAGARQLIAQQQPPARPAGQARPARPEPKMDPDRGRKLYVCNDPDDNSFGFCRIASACPTICSSAS